MPSLKIRHAGPKKNAPKNSAGPADDPNVKSKDIGIYPKGLNKKSPMKRG